MTDKELLDQAAPVIAAAHARIEQLEKRQEELLELVVRLTNEIKELELEKEYRRQCDIEASER